MPRDAVRTQSDEDRAEWLVFRHRARIRENLEAPPEERQARQSHVVRTGRHDVQVVIETLDPPWPERRELEPFDDEHELPDEAPPGWP